MIQEGCDYVSSTFVKNLDHSTLSPWSDQIAIFWIYINPKSIS